MHVKTLCEWLSGETLCVRHRHWFSHMHIHEARREAPTGVSHVCVTGCPVRQEVSNATHPGHLLMLQLI